jgi:hypothetical protein
LKLKLKAQCDPHGPSPGRLVTRLLGIGRAEVPARAAGGHPRRAATPVKSSQWSGGYF